MKREISSITPDECAGLWDKIMGSRYKGIIAKYDAIKDTAPERFILMQDYKRLGIQFDGKVWADFFDGEKLNPILLNQLSIKRFLNSANIEYKIQG